MSRAQIVPIIGGGPAGMSCALWLHNYGLRPVIIEQESALGGLARRSPYPNEWLLGQPDQTARENAARFAGHIGKLMVETRLGARPREAQRGSDGTFRLDVASFGRGDAQSLPSRFLVIATGTRFRGEEWLDRVANARRLAAAGRVLLGPTAVGEPQADPGSEVAVIGGGDNAFDVSRVLVEKGVRVTLVMRSHSPRAQPLLVERLRGYQTSGIARILAGRTVDALDDAGPRMRVHLDDGSEVAVDRLVLLLGYRPNTDQPWLADLALETDAHGYLVVDANMETSCRGVFAVGDVANPMHPCIATAIAAGTIAARQIQQVLAGGPALPPGS
ncbi:MAG: NAD(P)/FAD-dependent oxidoreductase [Xanthobacteraceae bacterium]